MVSTFFAWCRSIHISLSVETMELQLRQENSGQMTVFNSLFLSMHILKSWWRWLHFPMIFSYLMHSNSTGISFCLPLASFIRLITDRTRQNWHCSSTEHCVWLWQRLNDLDALKKFKMLLFLLSLEILSFNFTFRRLLGAAPPFNFKSSFETHSTYNEKLFLNKS